MNDKNELIEKLKNQGYLRTSRIIEAFLEINREDFILSENDSDAYEDFPLPIGHQQSISQPKTTAFMLELLEPKPGEKILEIGSGSGWQATLLGFIVGETGEVHSLEIIPGLSKFATNNTNKYGLIKNGIVKYYIRDGSRGYSKESPFDKIIISAATDALPKEIFEQLKVGGKLVAPVGPPAAQDIVMIEKHGEDSQDYKEERFSGFNFVPLIRGNKY